ncbi:MAG: EAL domain-containing protein [Sulfuricella denitrificans]|nr:EAL domain-containing protein [Sulfuricella denitrificans]
MSLRSTGLRCRLMLLILAAVLPAFLLVLYSTFEQRRNAAEYTQREALKLAQTVAEGHRTTSSSARQMLKGLSTLAEIPDIRSAGPCNKMVSGILRFYPDYANIGIALSDGSVVCSALPLPAPVNVADRGFFRRAVATRDFSIGDYQLGRVAAKRGIHFGYPLLTADKQIWGVVFILLDLDRLNERLAETPHLEAGDVVFLLDDAGIILARYPDSVSQIGKSINTLPLFRKIRQSQGEGTYESNGLDGTRRIFAFTPLFSGLTCCAYTVVGIPTEIVFAKPNHAFVRNVSLMVLIGLLVLIMAWVGGDLLVLKRVRALSGAARKMGQHDLSVRSGLPHDEEEIGQLARSFDEMADNLEAWQKQLLQSSHELEKLSYRNQLILNSAGEGICGVNGDCLVTFINPAAATMLGYQVDELIGLPLHETVHCRKADGTVFPHEECPMREAIESGTSHLGSDEMLWRKDGSVFYADYAVTPMFEDGKIAGAVVTFRDITERRRHEEQLAHQATHDALTGLANRTILNDRIGLLIERAAREKTVLALFLLDLDRFKEVNDSLGHSAGDELLRGLATRLTDLMRDSDTVARLGGDEFVILVEMSTADGAIPLAQKMIDALASPFSVAGQEVFTSTSIGISLYPKDGDCGEELLKNADVAMYRAKKRGRNAYRFYNEGMNTSSAERLSLESRLRHAVDNGELLLYYQPQLNLHSGEIIGAEALIRWQHPELGMVSPAKFIPLAEESGLIFPIGEWVMRTACHQLKTWQEAGVTTPPVAINLSAHQFRQRHLVKMTTGVLLDSGLEGRYLELEMTESAVMEDTDRVIRVLRELKDVGTAISIDDFGTGYSSLSYLKQFAIDKLKVDQSFVREITRDPSDAAIVVAIITMAHSLGLNVIAEGVETEGQLEYLRRHGCDEMQGYFFSRPVPVGDFEQMLRSGQKLVLNDQSEGSRERILLLLDDEPNVIAALTRLFRHEGYQILVAHNPGEAFELLASHRVGVILSDQCMPEMTGVELLRRVKRLYPDVVRIAMSGSLDQKLVADAFNQGAIYKYITKPWDNVEVITAIREAFLEQETYCSRKPGSI